jgi:hypothetical protein
MDEEQQRERADLLSRLFALITMKLEDAGGIAADCQGRRPTEALREGAERLEVLLVEASTVRAAAAALLNGD